MKETQVSKRRVSSVVILLIAVAVLVGVPALVVGGSGDGAGAADQHAVRVDRLNEETSARLAGAGIVDVPVQFTVQNINRSKAACYTDGQTYVVRGHLTTPRNLLAQPDKEVTLYQHGIGTGEWYWRMPIRGYHQAEEMARRGHASLTIDRIGYDSSDKPNGLRTCLGGQADMTHQIVEQLRAGGYRVDGLPAPAPAFGRVLLAGHHNGAQISQIEAYSFGDVDGLVLMGWADRGLTDDADATFFGAFSSCMQGGGGPAEKADDPPGYVYFDLGRTRFAENNLRDVRPEVAGAVTQQQNRTPCAELASQLEAVVVDLQHLNEITVPVLMVQGEQDSRITGGEQNLAPFTGTTDKQLLTVPGAGHFMGLGERAQVLHDGMASWLDRH